MKTIKQDLFDENSGSIPDMETYGRCVFNVFELFWEMVLGYLMIMIVVYSQG